jgi:futalosine hydrolase
MTLLVVTAVAAERDAVLGGLGTLAESLDSAGASSADTHFETTRVRILIGGVGVAAAAARTAYELVAHESATGQPYEAVVNMGIAGGYLGRAAIGDTVIGTHSVAADLGADSPDGFLTMSDLGQGPDTVDANHDLVARLSVALPKAHVGSVLTVQTVTGSAGRAAYLAERHHDAVAEAMEGYGVATAADLRGIAFAEIRTVSNLVGPRDRAAWRIGLAMAALSDAATALATLVT